MDELIYIEDAITVERENELLNCIETGEWQHLSKRKVQQYGYKYNYKYKKLTKLTTHIPDLFINTIEPWMKSPDQCIVNHYNPGEGISKHIDHPYLFGNEICILSLMNPINITFKYEDDVKEIRLAPRSLLIMKNDVRYKYSHEIAARKNDIVNHRRIKRKERISITFRTIK